MKKLLFIPGLLADATLWKPMIDILEASYHCQVANVNHPSNIEQCARALWNEVDGQVILVGFSLGAWIALQAYLLFPERCQGLILISSAPGSLTAKTRQLFVSYQQQIVAGEFEAFIQNDLKQDVASINYRNSQLLETLLDMMRKQGAEVALQQLNAILQFQGDFSNLNHIHCPTLLMRGVDDKSVNSKRQQEMCEEISQVKLVLIPNAAHYIPLENPVSTAKIIHAWVINEIKEML